VIVADKRRADRRRSPPLHDAPSEDVELHLTPVAAGSKDDGVDIYAALPTSEGSALAGASAGVSGHAFAAVSLRARSRRAATSSAARLRAPPPGYELRRPIPSRSGALVETIANHATSAETVVNSATWDFVSKITQPWTTAADTQRHSSAHSVTRSLGSA